MNTKPLVLFIGNYLYSDDKIGIIVGEKLKNKLINEGVDVEIMEKMGYSLIDVISNREIVIIVDSVKSSKWEIGEVMLLNIDEVDMYTPRSPHYSGLPEMLKLMKSLELGMPMKIYVIGIEVKDPYTISENLTPELVSKLDEIINKVYKMIRDILKI